MENLTFPEGFMCIGCKSFGWVFENRKEFVEFTINDMENPKGLFLKWKQFCKERLKNSDENKK